MYNLNKILNTEDTIEIGNKVFKIRELTLRERAALDKVLKEYLAKLNSLKNSPDEFLKDIQTKDSTDFLFISAALNPCNPGNLFTEEIFESMTTSQVLELQRIIMQVNNFFTKSSPKNAETDK